MEAEEIATHVDELELRLERLRVLYDQYFMGIEKMPPNVAQKDVDRRIWVLRREQIRNTGIRFRFQTIVQRYSTFGSYWMRIMREIENGTYKRHIQRAKKRFGDDEVQAPASAQAPAAVQAPPPPHVAAPPEVAERVSTFDIDLDFQLDDDLEPADDVPSAPPPQKGASPPAVASRPAVVGLLGMRAALPNAPAPSAAGPTTGSPVQPQKPIAPATVAPREPAKPAAPVTREPQKPAPLPATPPPAPSPSKQAATTSPRVASAPFATVPTGTVTRPVTVPVADPTTRPQQAAMASSVPKILAAKMRTDDDLDAMLDMALGGAKPASAKATTPGVQPARAAPAPPTAAPAPPPQAAVAPALAREPSRPERPERRAEPARPAVAAPSGGDFRQVYAKYVEARRNNGESTAGLTYDSLAKNLRDTTEKLKTKSGGKAIDFDVVVKDGKTILKPVVK